MSAPARDSGLCVLVVDDDRVLRELLCDQFARDGFVCVAARNAEEARFRFAEAAPALVVTDVDMPGGSGLDLAREFANYAPRVPVFVMSGTDQGRREEAAAAGALGFLEKPFRPVDAVTAALLLLDV